jgi:acetyl coenzyme A synthetase (ADP forming)-like protein
LSCERDIALPSEEYSVRASWETRRACLDQLFAPKSVALIGATNKLNKWGGMILANVLTNRFEGRVFPVNPASTEILGLRAYPKVKDIPEGVDLAVIVTPADTVPALIEDCGRKGIRTVLVVTSDFSEAGPEGKKREQEIREIARSRGVHLVGPNSMGVFSSEVSLVCMMAMMEPLKGEISFVSQSGNIGVQMLAWGKRLRTGFRHFVSSGNEADLTAQDYIRYFGEDPHCRTVMVYLESIKGRADFLETAREAARKKPVVVFKGGKTASGLRAAASHSGALAGKAGMYDASFRQAGLIQARTTEAFVDCARSLARLPLPRGDRVGIITRGGGWGVITTDACEQQGLTIPQLATHTLEALDRLLPPYWSRGNPIDLVAVPNIDIYLDCLEIVMRDPNVDGVIALGAFTERATSFMRKRSFQEATGIDQATVRVWEDREQQAKERVLYGTLDLMKDLNKPIVTVMGREPTPRFDALLRKEGLSLYPTPERAVRVMARLMEYARYRRRWEGERY